MKYENKENIFVWHDDTIIVHIESNEKQEKSKLVQDDKETSDNQNTELATQETLQDQESSEKKPLVVIKKKNQEIEILQKTPSTTQRNHIFIDSVSYDHDGNVIIQGNVSRESLKRIFARNFHENLYQ